MCINEFSIRAKDEAQCVLSWTNSSDTAYSWIFINGKFAFGPFMSMTMDGHLSEQFLGTGERSEQLFVQIVAVGDDHKGRGLHFRMVEIKNMNRVTTERTVRALIFKPPKTPPKKAYTGSSSPATHA